MLFYKDQKKSQKETEISLSLIVAAMDRRCVFHPDHRQSRGVCPSCLRERLSVISNSSSASSESPVSTSEIKRLGRNIQMKKSRSMVSVLGMDLSVVEDERKKGTENRGSRIGFWFGFLGKKKKEKDHGGYSLLHSSTVKESRRFHSSGII